MTEIHICTADDMHPYNCFGTGNCIHCDKKCDDGCALCEDSIPEIDNQAECLASKVIKDIKKQ